MRCILCVVAITLLSGHVTPSVDDNNRYLKLTPLGDRVRLAYTIFFGEVPGASERRRIDANGDGQIADAEAHAFGSKVGDEVAASLEVEVDGQAQPVHWDTVDVGMGTPVVAAGSFSVDLVAYLCLPTPHGAHHLKLRDRYRVPRPGETEIKVEDSLGVTIERARVGAADDPTFDYKFVGPGGPLGDDGLDLAFTAGPRAPVTPDAACKVVAASATSRRWLWLALVGGAAAAAGITLALIWRRKRVASPG